MGIPAKRLVLRRETLRNLDTDVQRRVDGGIAIATPTTTAVGATPTTPSVVLSVAASVAASVATYSIYQTVTSNWCVSKGCPVPSRCGRLWSTCPI